MYSNPDPALQLISYRAIDTRLVVTKHVIALSCFFLLSTSISFSQCLKDITDTKSVVITAMAEDIAYPAANAFDNDDDAYDGWSITHDAEPGNECWITTYFNAGGEIIRGYSISALDDYSGNNNKAPAVWELQGSTDGIGWITLDSRSAQAFAAPGETHIYSFSNNSAYSYYRIWITQTSLASSAQVTIGEIQLFAEVCITGTVFQDNGDRLSSFDPVNDVPLAGIPVSIVTTPAGTVFASTTTDVAGLYYFDNSEVPPAGSFSVIMAPPAGKIFVTHPANLWSSRTVLPSVEEEPPTGAVFFDYHLNTGTNTLSAVNRMAFAGGNIDFGLKDAVPPMVFGCVGTPANLITEADGGTFGTTTASWEAIHPHQKGFSYSGNLYNSIAAASTDYIFSNTSSLSGVNRGVLYDEGEYTVTSFLGTLSDLAYVPYMSQMLNNVAGGWRKSYGTTTADANDRFLAVNGATTGSLPFFKQTNLTLTAGSIYTLGFYGKHANSYPQGETADAQIVIELRDNVNTLVSSGSLNLNPTTSFADDRPEAPWQLRYFSFTAPGGSGPFTVQLRASTTAAMGNDFYIDDIALYPCSMGLLPIQLLNFSARQTTNSDVHLAWEIKNARKGTAEAEYSVNGKNFSKIGNINLESFVENYSLKHQQPGAGIHYYRLKILDVRGTTIYSAIKKVDIRNDSPDVITLYPNPVTNQLSIQSDKIISAIEIVDLSGKLVKKISASNTNSFQVDVSQIGSGIYYVKVIKRENISLHKIVVKK